MCRDIAAARTRIDEIAEARALAERDLALPLGDIADIADALARVSSLPEHTVIIQSSYQVDGAGRRFHGIDLVPHVSAAANRPVFTPLGLVTSIVGYKRAERVIEGRAGHAGTTPMDARDDALVAAAEEVLRIRDVALGIDGAVATVGRLEVEPGGVNVIPGRVRLTIDARAPDDERLAELLEALGIDPAGATPPTPLGGAPVHALRSAIAARGLPLVELASGAGHDAGVLARAGVPSAMLFVRALNGGVSHSPDELSSPEDVALAVDVLTDALDRLASS